MGYRATLFLHYKYAIREIAEPKGLLGIVDKAVLLLRQDESDKFTQAELNRLDALRFSNDIIAELDYKICREGRDLDTVTREWLDNQAQ